MQLPINFPDENEVIYEEARRFRALSPELRVGELNQCFQLYRFLREVGGRAEQIDQLAEEEEQRGWQAIQEFTARHAGTTTQ